MDEKDEAYLQEKYPEHYFEHYIACFASTHQTPDKAGFEKLAKLYIDVEGAETFMALIEEIQVIKENADWSCFESRAQDFDIPALTAAKLAKLAETAIEISKGLA